MTSRPFLLLLPVLGCARGEQIAPDGAPGPHPDGDETPDPDGDSPPEIDAPASTSGAALLLTEVVLQQNPDEMIEIFNPTASAVDLSTYYLSDSGNYFQLPAGGTVATTDFIVKFPANASIPANGVITVSIDTAANYQTKYGSAPTFSIGAGAAQMVAVSVVGTPNLTNTGELVVLFQWNGQSDLVRDVDMLLVGIPSAANGLVDKSGVAQDGPDADASTTAYATDAKSIAAQPTAPVANQSTKRIAREATHETQNGSGNGITGDDETSEQTATTWDTTYTAATPGQIPASIQ